MFTILKMLRRAKGQPDEGAVAMLGVAGPTLRYRLGKLGVTRRGPSGAEAPPARPGERGPKSQKAARKSRK